MLDDAFCHESNDGFEIPTGGPCDDQTLSEPDFRDGFDDCDAGLPNAPRAPPPDGEADEALLESSTSMTITSFPRDDRPPEDVLRGLIGLAPCLTCPGTADATGQLGLEVDKDDFSRSLGVVGSRGGGRAGVSSVKGFVRLAGTIWFVVEEPKRGGGVNAFGAGDVAAAEFEGEVKGAAGNGVEVGWGGSKAEV